MELQQLGAGLTQRLQPTTAAAATTATPTAVAAAAADPATPATTRTTMRDSICSLERDSLAKVVVSVSVNVDVHCDASTAL